MISNRKDWRSWMYVFENGHLHVKPLRGDELRIPVPSGPWRSRKVGAGTNGQKSTYLHLEGWDPKQLRLNAKTELGREEQLTVLALRYGWSPPEGVSILVPKPPKHIEDSLTRFGNSDRELAKTISVAASAGEWGVVKMLAEELAARREAARLKAEQLKLPEK